MVRFTGRDADYLTGFQGSPRTLDNTHKRSSGNVISQWANFLDSVLIRLQINQRLLSSAFRCPPHKRPWSAQAKRN